MIIKYAYGLSLAEEGPYIPSPEEILYDKVHFATEGIVYIILAIVSIFFLHKKLKRILGENKRINDRFLLWKIMKAAFLWSFLLMTINLFLLPIFFSKIYELL